MIRVPGEDGEGAVDLFCENERCHLVRECHGPEREQHVGPFATGFREAVGRPYAKGNLLMSTLLEFAKPVRKLGRAELFSFSESRRIRKLGRVLLVQG